jgi:hypothetical protein
MNNIEGILPCLGFFAFCALALPLIVLGHRLQGQLHKELRDLSIPDIKARYKVQENTPAGKALRLSLSLHFICVAVVVIVVILGALDTWFIPKWISFIGLAAFIVMAVNGMVLLILASAVFLKLPK